MHSEHDGEVSVSTWDATEQVTRSPFASISMVVPVASWSHVPLHLAQPTRRPMKHFWSHFTPLHLKYTRILTLGRRYAQP